MRKILIVDDHTMVCEGIKRVIEDVEGVEVWGAVHSGEDALKVLRKDPVDIVLMDVHMPGIGGLGATREIKRLFPNVKVIALSGTDDAPYPSKMMEAGASGYVAKGSDMPELLEAIDVVLKGEQYLSRVVAQKVALSRTTKKGAESPFDELSDRELQVAQMIVDCVKTKDIADKLNVSDKTVSTFRKRIFNKVGVESDVELARLAMRYNVLGLI
ncbi:two-component system response regulator UvrY [Marinomonas piezotolerans]|uniref:Two-component system response regulator UvrY n=1 Tax=Marinomonas piezotolerans TaxID=2213058 RepID=A0A370U5I3_9GAMM|nr:response regulator [Marinomonas piezotolerans]RDL43023.1 two-component system response regulator UvrY [Marinomonas piezotolerans]